MDNIFEVLIYLIIIISFISSLFKKKEEPKAPQTQQGSVKKESSDTFSEFDFDKSTVKSSDYDLLEEIESIFNQDFGSPKKNKDIPSEQHKIQSEYSLEHTKMNYDNFDIESRIILENQKKFHRNEIKIDSKTEIAAKMFEELLNKKGAKQKSINPLIKKIKNPTLIKDYILVSEILNKPLSLRK
jgi:predicted nucleotidyltransferase